jgi:hypothetical protein
MWYTGQRKTKQKHNTICVGHHHQSIIASLSLGDLQYRVLYQI